MTKIAPEGVRARKNGTVMEDAKLVTTSEEVLNDGDPPCDDESSEGESVSSVLSGEEVKEGDTVSSGEDTDHLISVAMDTIVKQASESKIVVPAEPAMTPVALESDTGANPVSKTPGRAIGESSTASTSTSRTNLATKRKLQEKSILRRTKKLSKEKRDRLKAKVSQQILDLPAEKARLASARPTPKIPKHSPARLRQQQAVTQARDRVGLSSKYGILSKLVDLHRFLLKGNPFALIEPKQVYPYFHLIPGINHPDVQPLILAWQEKTTRILYQLLLVETKGDIARLRRRTFLFQAEPAIFKDVLSLKIDIGLETEPVIAPAKENDPPKPGVDHHEDPSSSSKQGQGSGQPPVKKAKKVLSIICTKLIPYR